MLKDKFNIKHYVPSLRVIELEKENRLLRKKLAEKDARINALEQAVQDLQIQLTEFKKLLFKSKKLKKYDEEDEGHDPTNKAKQLALKPRSKESYRRQPPKEEDVTEKKEYTLSNCANCNSSNLDELESRVIYTEDIPLIIKEVIKETIHRYTCRDCKKEQSAHPIPRGQTNLIGPRVKQFVLYGTYILNLSFRDITRALRDYFHIEISDGEIKHIQQESAINFQPLYNGFHDELLEQEALNADETGWSRLQGIKGYLWGLFSPTTPVVLFHIGSRGKGNIEKLLKDFSGCLTSDCYAAYKKLAGLIHQVCWVHILRTIKDLKKHPELTEKQKQSAEAFYNGLVTIYTELKQALAQPFNEKQRKKAQTVFIERLQEINHLLSCDTPKKLKNIKLLTQKYEQELFACLMFKTALPENNLAERNLRHVVLKRKRSFGTRSEKGARIFAINASVILTLWRKYPTTFFSELEKVVGY